MVLLVVNIVLTFICLVKRFSEHGIESVAIELLGYYNYFITSCSYGFRPDTDQKL